MFAAALIAGALVGCSGQAASSSASASAASASASASASQSAETQATTEETVALLKEAMEKAKDFKSVTITHNIGVEVDTSKLAEASSAQSASASSASASASAAESASSAASDAAAAESQSLKTTTVYKFDQSGETVKSSSSAEFLGSTFKAFLDGDRAVVDFGGDAYAGTVEEMGAQELTSVDSLLKTKVGDFETITSCVSAADVEKQGDNTIYALVIDAAKYTETDEVEKALAAAGLKKEAFTVSLEFGADGKLVSISLNEKTTNETTQATLSFTDYDATTVDQAPETNKTYADMSAEIQAAVDELKNEEQGASQIK